MITKTFFKVETRLRSDVYTDEIKRKIPAGFVWHEVQPAQIFESEVHVLKYLGLYSDTVKCLRDLDLERLKGDFNEYRVIKVTEQLEVQLEVV
jgi:hypothetical protein